MEPWHTAGVQSLDEIGPGLPAVARRAIWERLSLARLEPSPPGDAPAAGVFVTLRTADGALRGCIGSISPLTHDVRDETARSAVLAATRDPRFDPVLLDELGALSIEVSVLAPEEPVSSVDELDPRIYGVIVRDRAGRRGLLLPEIPGVDDARVQVAIAREKAGISGDEPVTLSRFRVRKYLEAVTGGRSRI
jgi:AmmeMemoRadiSam system protein A